MVDFCSLEINLLNSINYEMEFDVPCCYMEGFKSHFLNELSKKMSKMGGPSLEKVIGKVFKVFHELTLKFVRDSYLRDFCLYFPGPVIFAACLLITD